MIVRILSSSASFSGVAYNMDKVDREKGELMTVVNFGAQQGLLQLRPEDYKNYLRMVSATNKAVKKPQFHAAISAEGKSYDKQALTEIAIQWLQKMGYGEQPYLVIYHKDTRNNHVHVVSTRVNRQGKKINSGFENIRAIRNLNAVLGIDEQHIAAQDIAKALSYNFFTKAQYMMILESQGYALKEGGGKFEVIKFGHKQAEIDLDRIAGRIKTSQASPERIGPLRAIFHKYAKVYDTTLAPNIIPALGNYQQKTNGYTSEFARYLKDKHGLHLIFHAKDDKPPYGYTVIDHSNKAVFKGGEIMPLKELLSAAGQQTNYSDGKVQSAVQLGRDSDAQTTAYYRAILEAVTRNYPDLPQGLHHLGLNIGANGGRLFLEDRSSLISIPVNELLDKPAQAELQRQYYQLEEMTGEIHSHHIIVPAPVITPDVDDEAINGRNRRRKTTGSGRDKK